MGELHDAVTALLDAFARGISVIRAQHSRRKEEQLPVDLVQQTAETHVRKSLKKSRADVKEAYTRDLARYGPRFAAGDAEARSAFSLILLRLNAAFMSIIERFTKGRSTREDYHTLMSLSNASRLEAMRTFEQLSKRLPQSALSLTPQTKSSERHTHSSQKRRSKQIPSVKSGRNRRSQSAPPVLKTKASDNPRPRRTHKKPSGNSKSSTISKTPRSTEDKHRSTPSPHSTGNPKAAPPNAQGTRTSSRSERRHRPRSFRSDSTKLGEIPEHKWAVPRDDDSSLRIAYPLYTYTAPQKQRSRFMRFFGK